MAVLIRGQKEENERKPKRNIWRHVSSASRNFKVSRRFRSDFRRAGRRRLGLRTAEKVSSRRQLNVELLQRQSRRGFVIEADRKKSPKNGFHLNRKSHKLLRKFFELGRKSFEQHGLVQPFQSRPRTLQCRNTRDWTALPGRRSMPGSVIIKDDFLMEKMCAHRYKERGKKIVS